MLEKVKKIYGRMILFLFFFGILAVITPVRVSAETYIDTVKADITLPVEGEHPDYDQLIIQDYYWACVEKWYDGGTVSSPGNVMSKQDTFTGNKEYIAELNFTPDTNSYFESFTKAVVNGITAPYYKVLSSGVYVCRVSFTAHKHVYSWKAADSSGCIGTCSCGKSISSSHEFGLWTYTEENSGLEHVRSCSRCGYKESEAHISGEKEWVISPTLTQEGSEIQKCTVCNEVINKWIHERLKAIDGEDFAVAVPETGMTPGICGYKYGTEKSTIASAEWDPAVDKTFEANTEYTLILKLETINRYAFSNDTVFKVNDQAAKRIVPQTISEHGVESVTVIFTFPRTSPAPTPTPIPEPTPPEETVTAPQKVTVKAVDKTDKTLSLQWTRSSEAEGYNVYAKIKGESSYKKMAVVYGGSKTAYTIKNLKPGTAYQIVVKAWRKHLGNNVYSSASKTVTATTRPSAAVIQSVSANNNRDLKVQLKGKAAGAQKYAMCYSTRSDFKNYTVGLRTDKTSGTIAKKLKPGTYYVRVRSYRIVNGNNLYGSWSKTKKIVIK